MEVLGINGVKKWQTRSPGFWRRQFAGAATTAQLAFDIIFGIVGPVLCFIFDPIVFRGGFGGGPLLPEARPLVYLISGLEIITLMLWLIVGQSHYWKRQTGGILIAGGVLCVVIGLLPLPFSILGLMFFFIGVLGFTPFVTAIIFFRNGYRAIRSDQSEVAARRRAPVLVGFLLAIGLPVLFSLAIHQAVILSVNAIIQGDPQRASSASEALQWLNPLTSTELDQIVNVYVAESDAVRKEQLRKSYLAITGDDIEMRLRRLQD